MSSIAGVFYCDGIGGLHGTLLSRQMNVSKTKDHYEINSKDFTLIFFTTVHLFMQVFYE